MLMNRDLRFLYKFLIESAPYIIHSGHRDNPYTGRGFKVYYFYSKKKKMEIYLEGSGYTDNINFLSKYIID